MFFFLSPTDWNDLMTVIGRIDRNVIALKNRLSAMEKEMSEVDNAIAELTTQVAANTDAENAAAATIAQLAALIHASADDPAAIRELSAKLKTSAEALAAAIVAGTTAN